MRRLPTRFVWRPEFLRLTAAAALVSVCASAPSASADQSLHSSKSGALVNWQEWSDDIFERAKRENRLVLLDLEAIWCHWCHVMDEKTYSAPAVAKVINDKYIAVKVDQDSRPDLSNRYENYGWPATVFFAPDGHEMEIRSGFIQPKEMLSLVQSLPKNKKKVFAAEGAATTSTEVKFAADAALSPALRKELEGKHVQGYDTENGGWGFEQKFLDWDTVEYAMLRAMDGDSDSLERARETLKKQRKLIDPAWGGVYQYSTNGDWEHPHFEKIMQMQSENLRIYALAWSLWKDEENLAAARSIERYLRTFLLSPEGAFYTSQDADLVPGEHSGEYFGLDDAQRRKKGIPRVDKHVYSRENGWAITALVSLYMATGDTPVLEEAKKAAQWIIENRSLSGGGFRHDGEDKAGPYLGDSLAMGRAFLTLYAATAERKWLLRAEEAAKFMTEHFARQNGEPGFATADLLRKNVQTPQPLLDENVMTARFANLLYRYTGQAKYQDMAKLAMRYLATPEIARQRRYLVAGILLADRELGSEPAHITVLGSKGDATAEALYLASLKFPATYKRIEWWDRKEGPLANPDVEYPDLKKAAAFACVQGRCSAPVYDAEAVKALIDRELRKEGK